MFEVNEINRSHGFIKISATDSRIPSSRYRRTCVCISTRYILSPQGRNKAVSRFSNPPPSPIDMTIIVAGSGTRDNPFRRPRNEFPDIYVSFDPLEEVTNSNVATLQQHDLHPNQFPQFPSPEFPNPSIYRFSDIFAQ